MKLSPRKMLILEKDIARLTCKVIKGTAPHVKIFLTPRDSCGNLKVSCRVY